MVVLAGGVFYISAQLEVCSSVEFVLKKFFFLPTTCATKYKFYLRETIDIYIQRI